MPLLARFASPIDVDVTRLAQTYNKSTGLHFSPVVRIPTRSGHLAFVNRTQPAHSGTDITVQGGGGTEPIYAIGAGRVVTVATAGNAGHHVEINHEDGWASRYLHMPIAGATVQVGERVSKRQQIGWVGCTGKCTGPHVHLDLYYNVPPDVNNIFGYSGKVRVNAMDYIGEFSPSIPQIGGGGVVQTVLWGGLGAIGLGAVIYAAREWRKT